MANVIFFVRFWKSERKSTRLSITNSTKIHTMNFAKKDIPILYIGKPYYYFPFFMLEAPISNNGYDIRMTTKLMFTLQISP